MKGELKEVARELRDNPRLEAEGADEKMAGKALEK